MIFTKIAWLIGLALVATMTWLAFDGLTIVVPFLVTGFVLLLLVGGGNMIGGRSAPGRAHRTDGGSGGQGSG
jgi:hypothetical protein